MRLSHVSPAIVLRTWPFGESDKIVSFLTEHHGKISGIAKGAKRSRKRFANSLEPFSLVRLRFQDRPGSSLVFIQACDLHRGFQRLATSVEKIAFASYLVEITAGLIGEWEENRLVYKHLREGLTYLEQNGTSLEFLTFFELKLLRLVGYQPLFDSCRRCGKCRRVESTVSWHFSPREGGILCEICSTLRKGTIPLARDALEFLTQIQSEAESRLGDISLSASALREIRSVVPRFIQFHMDKEIKSASFLREISTP